MKAWAGVLAALIFWGCSGEQEAGEGSNRTLWITSDVPDSVYWEIQVDFEATADKALCKTFSFGSGKMEQTVKIIHYELKGKSGPLEIPLYMETPIDCGWEFKYLSVGRGSWCVTKDAFSVSERKKDYRVPMPDTVAYQCHIDSTSSKGCLKCSEREGRTRRSMDFLIDTSHVNTRMHLQVNISKP